MTVRFFSICQSGGSTQTKTRPKMSWNMKAGRLFQWPVWREGTSQCPVSVQLLVWELKQNVFRLQCNHCPSHPGCPRVKILLRLFPCKTFLPLPGHCLGRGHDNQGSRAQNRRHIMIQKKSVLLRLWAPETLGTGIWHEYFWDLFGFEARFYDTFSGWKSCGDIFPPW